MYGLVLAGGGARGAFQAGVIKALLDNGYKFDGVAGTSIGALNGVMVVQEEFEKSIDLWQNMEFSRLFDLEDEYLDKILNKKIDKDSIKYLYQKLKEAISNHGIDTTKIRNLLYEYIDEEKVMRSSTDFGIVTVSTSERRAYEIFKEDIPQGKLADYIMASANFPGFKKVVIDNKSFIDGGIYDNLPINLLAEKGYKDIIAITTGGRGIATRKRKVKDKSINITYINPTHKTGNTLNFSKLSVQQSLNIGYLDGMKMIKGYKGDKLYIDNLEYPAFELELLNLPREFFVEMCRNLEIPCFQSNMVNLVGITGKLVKLCKYKNFHYIGEVFVALCELAALGVETDVAQVFTLKKLIRQTVGKYLKDKEKAKGSDLLYNCFLTFAKYYK